MESPPAPPLPPPPSFSAAPVLGPKPPSVAPNGPPGAFLVELLVYNGSPFKDHWAYFVRSNTRSSLGVKIHATGDVRNGFIFEVKRMRDLDDTEDQPTARIPLQWVDAEHFNENAMFNNGISTINTVPVCGFEVSAHKVQAPGKSLNAINDPVSCLLLIISKHRSVNNVPPIGHTRKKGCAKGLSDLDC